MKKRNQILAVLMILLLGALCLGGCSQSETQTEAQTQAAATGAADNGETSAETGGDLLAQIQAVTGA